MKKILIIIIVAIAILGGGAYYEFFYLPPTYSKAVLKVVQEFETMMRDMPRPESVSDAADKIVAIKQQHDFFKQLKEKILLLRPPFFGKLRQFNEDILVAIDAQLGVYAPYEKQIEFFGGILGTQTIFKKLDLDERTTKVTDIQKHFEEAIPKVQMQIDGIFSNEPSFTFKEATFTQLKSAWQQARPGLDIWLGFIKRMDPDQLLGTNISVNPTKTEQDALEKVTTFFELVKKASERNVELSQFTPPSNTEDREREQRINEVIRELKNAYGQQ